MPIKPVHDEFVIAGDTTLHWLQWGEQGPPIICIHGLTAHAYSFQAFADELANDARVIAYDLRGRGDSDKPEDGYSIPLHAEDLAGFIEDAGFERPILIGHSLGALIALYFAAHYPHLVGKLVLIDAGAQLPWKSPAEQPAWLTASIGRLGTPISSYKDYIAFLKTMPFLGPYWNEYMDLYFKHDVYSTSDGMMAKAYREALLEEAQHFHEVKPEAWWGEVQVPTLLLRAGKGLFSDNDHLLTEEAAEAARQGIPHCRYVNFPTLNHHTIIFGVERGPAEEIRKFIQE